MFCLKFLALSIYLIFIDDALGEPLSNPTACYYIGPDKVTREEAINVCQSVSMSLVSIQTKEKNDAINNFFVANGVNSTLLRAIWTSGYKIPNKSIWKWITGETITFTAWTLYEPSGDGYCISIFRENSAAFWNDVPCVIKYYPLCENILIPCPVPTSPVPDTPVPTTPVSDTTVPDTTVPTTPVSDTPVPDTPVSDTPVPDTTVPTIPVSDTPLPDTPVPTTPVPTTPVPDTPVQDTCNKCPSTVVNVYCSK